MYSSKKNVLETVSLLKAYGISQIVLSPGSRNAPFIQSFASDSFFKCHAVVDERSAGFFAIGLINKTNAPVALCCTSGTALLNYGPAVAEAFYQELPLVVLSADRSPAWIGQLDGQTLPQPAVFGSLVRKSVHLPEMNNVEEAWHANRLINEALSACTTRGCGPVHINIPLSEPLFHFTTETLPEVRRYQVFSSEKITNMEDFRSSWYRAKRRMIVVGQRPASEEHDLSALLEKLQSEGSAVVFCEHLSQIESPSSIGNFDAIITSETPDILSKQAPDLLLTMGGHLVSKQLKQWLRTIAPTQHWHLSLTDEKPDTYQHVTHFVQSAPEVFLPELLKTEPLTTDNNWVGSWKSRSEALPVPDRKLPFSDMTVTGSFMQSLPAHSVLFAANSSAVRNIQLFERPIGSKVFCNRGTNGIEGTLSTACGYASISSEPVFVETGDLSFFYDLNILTGKPFPANLRILLLNNGGGGIFHLLTGLNEVESLNQYVSAGHEIIAAPWVKAAGLRYLSADSFEQLDQALTSFINKEGEHAMVLEVFTNMENNKVAFQTYYQQLKKK
jgi:2-succinyl-5-enolpyruvyl-6-hydroxy-3-cyclohexene-1-carboxylate synthase